ncbi:FHA domain-containing protein [Actinokineospora sp. 24-640]
MKRCPSCGKEYEDSVQICPEDATALEAAARPPVVIPERLGVPGPEAALARAHWGTEVCWRCATPSPNQGNTACANTGCRASLTPPLLHIAFGDGEVAADRGERFELGRAGRFGRVFRAFPNVSRRHAVVGVDDAGRPWVIALPTPNGTFINDAEIDESIAKTLFSGDRLRLAVDVEGAVTVYDR